MNHRMHLRLAGVSTLEYFPSFHGFAKSPQAFVSPETILTLLIMFYRDVELLLLIQNVR
jgi:hypothetical protein